MMLLSACDMGTTTQPTATTAPAAPTNTTAATTDATPTTAGMTDATPTTGGMTGSTFDPTKVKKLEVESGATLRLSGWSSTPAELEIVRAQLDRFKQVYPEVTVNYEPIAGDYNAAFKTMVSGGNEPDVFYAGGPLAEELIAANKLLELNSAMDSAGVKSDAYYEQLISIFSKDGKVYGLPKDFGTLALFYNTDMVTTPPKAGWNWNDYSEFVKANTTGSGNEKVFGVMHPPDNARWLPFAIANGAKVINDDGTTTGINSPEAVEAMDFYYGLLKDGNAGLASDVAAGWPGEAFGKKRTASAIEGGWMIPFLNDPASGFDVNYKAVELPVSPKGNKGNLLFTNSYSAAAKTQYPKAASALVLFLSGPENQREVMLTGFALPTLKNDASGKPFKDDPYFTDHPDEAVLFASLEYGTVHHFGPAHDKIGDSINKALERVIRGQQGSKESLDQAAQEINALLGR
jgi:multiple sugar transport system substrate-binding protein